VRFFLILAFLGFALTASGQSPQIDSLKRHIEREDDSGRKVELLNALSFAYFDVDVEQANSTTQLSLQISQQLGDKQGEAWALVYRGLYLLFTGQLTQAREYFELSLSLGLKLKDHNLQTYSLTQLGNVCRDKGIFDSAYQFYRQAERVSRQHQDDFYHSALNMNVGRYFLTLHESDSALRYIQKAVAARELGRDSVRLADAWILIGNCYLGKDDIDEAERYFLKASRVLKKDPAIQANYLQSMGEVHFGRGDFQLALENWNRVLTYHRKTQYKYALAELLFRMGAVLEEQGYFELANEYLANALKVCMKANYQYLTGRIYREQAWLYYRSRNFEIALKNNLEAEKILTGLKAELDLAGCWDLRGLIERNLNHYDTALYYHQKSLTARTRLNNQGEMSDGYFNLGEFYSNLGKADTALAYYFKSLSIDRGHGDKYGVSLNNNRIGKIYTSLSVFDSAKIYLDRSLALATPISANEIFRDNYLDLAAYFEKTGRPAEAIKYYIRYNHLSDSLFSKQTAQSLASYRTLYDLERNERQIELLNKDNQLTKAVVSRQRTIVYSAIAGSMVLLVLAVFYYRFNRKLRRMNVSLEEKNDEIQAMNQALSSMNRAIAEQKEEIQAQAEELIESNQTISRINESLEERIEKRTVELKQAYNELDTFFYRSSHDFKRPLTTFMGLAEVAKIMVKDNTALELFNKVDETARNLDKMLIKLQSISNVGVQELIYEKISIEALFQHELHIVAADLIQKNIRTEVQIEPGLFLYSYPALVKVIVENLIENAILFCGFNEPFIRLQGYRENGEVVLVIEDNGQGIERTLIGKVFDMYFRGTERSKGNGLGLYIVKKAADKLKARIVLESDVSSGTRFSIFFP
jgi:signal transduction histidine kinase